MTAVPSPYITAREAIAYLKLGSRSGLQRLIVEHRLPYCRRGGMLLFDVRELDAWLRQADGLVPTVTALRKRA